MATYDPKRNRPPVTEPKPEEPVPVEGLLVDLREAAPVATAAPSRPSIIDVAPPPDPATGRIAVVAGVAAATAIAVVLFRRRRQNP